MESSLDLLDQRALVFAACKNTATSYHALGQAGDWPLAHTMTGNIGGLIAPSLALAYYPEVCGCISATRRPTFEMQFYARSGRGFFKSGRLTRVPSQDPADPLYGKTAAALVRIEGDPVQRRSASPSLRRTLPDPGEPVFAYALVQDVWVLGSGRFVGLSSDDEGEQLETTVEVFHGYCGSLLFDTRGRLLGLGAKMMGTDEAATRRDGRWRRAYGRGLFQPLASLLPRLLSRHELEETSWR